VFIILLVAGVAVGWRAQEGPARMAGLTGDFRMPAFELEGGKIVVEFSRSPALLGVAICTICAKAASVRVIPGMTGETILGGPRKVTELTRLEMASVTREPGMPSLELEGKAIMVETTPKAVQAVMAVETGATVRQCMCGHECNVHSTMAGVAPVQIECGYIFGVTVRAGERLTRRRKLVTV